MASASAPKAGASAASSRAAAVIAVFHDTLITIGLFSIFNKEIDLTVIAALLTLVGYSMNDTIVIFDRLRENL